MTPHTLEEQKALLTAEAEGRVVRYVGGERPGSVKTHGLWNFVDFRYEAERPLMEGWINEYQGYYGSLYSTKELAEGSASNSAIRIAVHMKEVR